LDALAAADAARGDFAEATATARRAIDKATAVGDVTLASAIRDRLQLYTQNKPASASHVCPATR
jgi:hypothetical protein